MHVAVVLDITLRKELTIASQSVDPSLSSTKLAS